MLKKTVEDLEKRYPPRNLEEGAIVARFAPSPTGFLHTGSLFATLIAWRFPNQTNGVFFTRLEDTDTKREIEGSGEELLKQLEAFGITPNEGYMGSYELGNYGPYKQSIRKEIYQAYAKYMIEMGKAYPCFCTPEDGEEMRKKQETAGVRPGYYGVWAKCRNLSIDEMIERINNGEKYIVRFKSPGKEDRKIRHKDVIKGNVDFPENDQDIVIIKADGLPTYHFAHIVDDH